MILTVTMNPSVDVSYQLPDFKIDGTNRVTAENVRKTAGGKGLNVTRVIHELAEPVEATGLIGGTLGEYIEQQLEKDGIKHDFAQIDQESRNCIAILHDGKQTEILEAGPTVSETDLAKFVTHYQMLLAKVSVVTISGSLPKGAPIDFYMSLIKMANEKNIPVLLDTSGEALKKVLLSENKPYLIKPNQEELAALVDEKISSAADLQKVLQVDLFKDIAVIVVSLGKDGAFIKVGQDFYQAKIPTIKVANPVGSGDATIAGLATAIERKLSVAEMIQYGMATGVLNTMEEQTGHIDKNYFEKYFALVKVEKI